MSSILRVGYYSGVVYQALSEERISLKDETGEQQVASFLESNPDLNQQIPTDIRASVIKLVAAQYGTESGTNLGKFPGSIDSASESLTEILSRLKDSSYTTEGVLEVARMLQSVLGGISPEVISGLESEWEKFKVEDVVNELCSLGIPKEVIEGQKHFVRMLTIVKELPSSERKNIIERLKSLSKKDREIKSNSDAEKYISEYKELLRSVSKELGAELGALVMEETGNILQIIVNKIDPANCPDSLPKASLEQAVKNITEGKIGEALKTIIGESNMKMLKDSLINSAEFLQDVFGINVAALVGLDKGWGNGWGKWIVGAIGGGISGLGLFFGNDKGKDLLSGIGGLLLGGMASAFKEVRTASGAPLSLGKNDLQKGWADGWGKWIVTAVAGLTTAFGIGSSEEKSSSVLTTLGSVLLGAAIGSSSNTARTGLGIPIGK